MTDKTEAQPEALRLAEFFESLTKSSHRWGDGVPVHEKAATVLRAQATEIEQLKAQLSARQAAPDGRLRTALERIIGWNRDHANELCGNPDRAEGWACVREARAALSAAPPPPEREPLTDEQIERDWQFLHDEEGNPPDHHDFARAIEVAHGIGSPNETN